jgi:hypothetical protein
MRACNVAWEHWLKLEPLRIENAGPVQPPRTDRTNQPRKSALSRRTFDQQTRWWACKQADAHYSMAPLVTSRIQPGLPQASPAGVGRAIWPQAQSAGSRPREISRAGTRMWSRRDGA